MATTTDEGWDRLDSVIAGSLLLILISDILLRSSDILLPLLYFVPVGLSAFSNRIGLSTVTALTAIIFTVAGYGPTATASSISQALNRALLISVLFLTPPVLGMLKLMTTDRQVLLVSRLIAWLTCGAVALRDDPAGPLQPLSPESRKHWARYN